MEKLFGWLATVLSLLYKIPQIIKLYRTKQIGSLSFCSIFCQLVSYSFYIVHGLIIDDMPIVVMGSVSLIQSIILVGMFLYYRRSSDS